MYVSETFLVSFKIFFQDTQGRGGGVMYNLMTCIKIHHNDCYCFKGL